METADAKEFDSTQSVEYSLQNLSIKSADEKGYDDDDDTYYFNSNLVDKALGEVSPSSRIPISIPNGGRLMFSGITAVGTARDDDNKLHSVFYLEVHCHVAIPDKWFVYRRYSQFRKLSDVLRNEGYYVPVLPPKRLLGTFSIEFLKQRKIDLEKWLCSLLQQHSKHPGSKDPQTHPFYRLFLTDDANYPPQLLQRVYPENIHENNAKLDDTLEDSKKVSIF